MSFSRRPQTQRAIFMMWRFAVRLRIRAEFGASVRLLPASPCEKTRIAAAIFEG
jgi:hypothetical protein